MSQLPGAVGLEPIASVAARNGVTTRCMKRRLFRLAAKLSAAFPAEPPLLHRLGADSPEGGRWFVDRAVAWRFARGLIGPGGEDPWLAVVRLLDEWRDEQREISARIESKLLALEAMAAAG